MGSVIAGTKFFAISSASSALSTNVSINFRVSRFTDLHKPHMHVSTTTGYLNSDIALVFTTYNAQTSDIRHTKDFATTTQQSNFLPQQLHK